MAQETLEVLDNAIYKVYQRGHKDRPGVKLDATKGELARLWSLFDWAIKQQKGSE